jgi:hypothetical protein
VAAVDQRHRSKRAGDPLSDRDEHVELARVRLGHEVVGQADQVVGRVAHRGEDGDDAVPRLSRRSAAACDRTQLLGVGDRRPAELHHHQTGRRGGVLDGGDGLVLDGRHRRQV